MQMRWEYLSIVLQYLDGATMTVREDVVECEAGRDLANKIKSTLQGLGFDLSYVRGQACDGAGNMAGSVNGTASLISTEYPLAIYLHCASHCLNLESLEVTGVRNMMGIVGRVYQFLLCTPNVSEHSKQQYPKPNHLHLHRN